MTWKPTITQHERLLAIALRKNGIVCRQNPLISGYYPDIEICGTNILIEIDGGVHASPAAKWKDRQRTKHLNLAGYRVLRFSNNQVENKLRNVIAKIKDAIAKYQSGRTGLVFRGKVDPRRKEKAREKAKALNSKKTSKRG